MNVLRSLLGLVLSCLVIGGITVASQTTLPKGKLQPPEPIVKGVDLFKFYCAVCHGVDAKGDGPLAPQLKAMPANLTVLARNNKGQFPGVRVRKMIAGDDEPGASHGTRVMPVWGPIFRGIVSDQVPADVRLANLVEYLESIQQK
jgi:mono/diheme cytochrome c family protein